MALIYCPECRHKISDRARACPSCGHPNPIVEEKGRKVAIAYTIFWLLLLLIPLAIYFLSPKYSGVVSVPG